MKVKKVEILTMKYNYYHFKKGNNVFCFIHQSRKYRRPLDVCLLDDDGYLVAFRTTQKEYAHSKKKTP
jgi:hypothetical protein